MKINRLVLQNYRNIEQLTLSPVPSVNVICGDNGQGKTNLIEALWLFCGAGSFRGSKEKELIRFDADVCSLSVSFFSQDREQNAFYQIAPTRKVLLNDVEKKSPAELSGSYFSVVFSPEDMTLLKGAPQQRRAFLDHAIAQISPRHQNYINDYRRILQQRNTLLKEAAPSPAMLEIWDDYLARYAGIITKSRFKYIDRIKNTASDLYRGISNGKESFALSYVCSIEGVTAETPSQEITERYLAALRQTREEDLRLRQTQIGPHREDFLVTLSGLPTKIYGSQGQQRSCVLALKLSECEIIEQLYGEQPVILLDDVLSELDPVRQDYLLHRILEKQIFITCCDKAQLKKLSIGRCFSMTGGVLREETD